MASRRVGFYWVKRAGKWSVAEWSATGYWYFPGINHGIDNNDRFIEEVNEERIHP